MNSNYGKSGSSINSFDFDLGLSSGRSRSLKDQKNNTSSYSSSSYTYSSTQSKPNSGSLWNQPNKSTWTHQPTGSLSGPTSMDGDIFGKNWASSAPSTASNVTSSVGIANKNPDLFGDLVNSAFRGNKCSSNAPLKNANKSAFSMSGMADNLPKSGNSVKTGGIWGSGGNSGGGNAGDYNVYSYSGGVNLSGGNSKSPNLGGTSSKNMAGSGVGGGMGVNKDPFGSLVDFSSKPRPNMKSGGKETKKNSSGDDMFGDYQNASKSGGSGFPSDPFPTSNINNASTGWNSGGAYSKVDDFGFTNTQSQPYATQSSGVGDFDSLFSSGEAAGVSENQQFTGGDDWGFESEFASANDSSGSTEIEGLPQPPSGVSAFTAKNKGMDNHKQGQYADAIKWLSWAVILLEKAGDEAGVMELLTSRASCYKEVGEYKKAVADCTKLVTTTRALIYLPSPVTHHYVLCCFSCLKFEQ
ncbi:unnamed protein product [Withania somnifera]